MHITTVSVPREWVKLTDLMTQGRTPFKFEADKTYYIHNKSDFVLYLSVGDKVSRLYAGKSAGYVKTDAELMVSNQLPDVYPYPAAIDVLVSDDEVVAKAAIALGDYKEQAPVKGAYVFKGSVADRTQLPAEAEIGDVYNLEDNGMNVAWTGTLWDDLGATVNVDLTPYAKEEKVAAAFERVGDDIDDIKDNMSVLATKEEVTEALATKAEAADLQAVEAELGTKADKEAIKNAVLYKDFNYNGQDRKTIQLDNYDSISGIATDGTGHNLAMISKWDVADFGAPGVHCNLNTKDTVTINDNKVVATVDMLEAKADKEAVAELDTQLDKAIDAFASAIDVKADKTALEALATKEEVAEAVAAVDHSTFATKEELAAKADTVEVYNALDTKASKAELEEAVKDAVDYQEFVYNGETRKTIQLANYDSISGVSTTGAGHNLVMLSKWDVADFGAPGVHCNLNTVDTVTINDTKVVATTEDIESALENAVDYQYFTYTNAEGETQTRKTIQLNNYDSVSGVDTTGSGHNLVMLSKWNVADFGAPGVHCNLNTSDTVTINDNKVVATTDLIEALEAKITALEARVEELENKNA